MDAKTIAQFRRRIGDRVKSETDNVEGNGTDKVFNLRFSNVTNVFVYDNNGVVDSATYEVDSAAGTVTFDTAPTQGKQLQFDYDYSAYTDDEITQYVTDYGFDTAVTEVLRELLADSARMYDYSEGATDAKLSQIYKQLSDLLDRYEKEASTNAQPENSVSVGRRIADPYRSEPIVIEDLSRDDL